MQWLKQALCKKNMAWIKVKMPPLIESDLQLNWLTNFATDFLLCWMPFEEHRTKHTKLIPKDSDPFQDPIIA